MRIARAAVVIALVGLPLVSAPPAHAAPYRASITFVGTGSSPACFGVCPVTAVSTVCVAMIEQTPSLPLVAAPCTVAFNAWVPCLGVGTGSVLITTPVFSQAIPVGVIASAPGMQFAGAAQYGLWTGVTAGDLSPTCTGLTTFTGTAVVYDT